MRSVVTVVGVGGVVSRYPRQLASHLAHPLSCGEHFGRADVVNWVGSSIEAGVSP